MKQGVIIAGIIVILVALFGTFIVPCTPPSERALCKKEIGILRGYLLCSDFGGNSFFSNEFSSNTNELELLVGSFCDRANQISKEHIGKAIFHVVSSPYKNGMIIVDRWGTPYNFCTADERQRNHWDALKYCEVSNIVVWSSGPNTINEYGSNDDVALCIRVRGPDPVGECRLQK